MKSAGKARNNGLYRHIRTSKEIIRNLLNDYFKYFDYLDDLRKSGRVNMYGAVPFLLEKFPELFGDAKRAAAILKAWMDSYRTGGKEE